MAQTTIHPDIRINIPQKSTLESKNIPTSPVPVFYEYPVVKADLNFSPSRLIEQHLTEVRRRIDLHSRAAEHYEYWNRVFGYPITIISGFLSSTMMYALALENNNFINTLNLVLSCILFFFSATKEYLKYDEKNKSHDISSKLYTTLTRSVELRLIKNNEEVSLEEKKDMYKDLVEQMTIIEQFDLTIPDRIIKKHLRHQSNR